MRLGTCIALELAIAIGAIGGVWLGASQLASHAHLGGQQAIAATPEPALTPEPLPRAHLPVTQSVVIDNVFGVPDSELLGPLGMSRVTKIKLNQGGTSLSIRVDFANGTRASFKPQQIHPQSDPRREIAAYRIDRLLGIGHVAPAKEISIPLQQLLDGAAEQEFPQWITRRILDEAKFRDGVVHGEASWWIPEIKLARIGPHRIDEAIGRDVWTAYLQVGARIPPEHRSMLQQISLLVLFDVLIDNADRWSGSNTEMSPDGKILYFMDNTLSFSIAKFGHEVNVMAMRRVQVFPKRFVQRLRELTYEALVEALAVSSESKLGPLLNPAEIRAVLARRDNMLRYIDLLIAQFGEDAVLALP